MTAIWQASRSINLAKIPDQTGKVYLVTGGNTGLGYEMVKALAAKNAHVFMTSRNSEKQKRAIQSIQDAHPGAEVEGLIADYGRGFQSIANCAAEFRKRDLPLHGLINNVGTENPPDMKSGEGFDPTMATNYLGAFYLTHLLLKQLTDTPKSRIVQLTSLVEPNGGIEWSDIGGRHVKRSGYQTYSDSKLMLYMFTVEMQKRLTAAGSSAETFSAHPGVAQTDAFRKSDKTKLTARILASGASFIGQSAQGGAQSILNTLTDPSLTGKGGGDQHYGCWYTGLPIKPFGQTWPLCFTVNWDNYGSRSPINPLIRDTEACHKLYTETLRLINDNAATKIDPIGQSSAVARS